MTANSFDEDDPIISTHRMRIRRIFKRGLYAIYFIGVMYSFRNRVQMYGAIRPIQYYEKFEANKHIEQKKKSFLVKLLFDIIFINLFSRFCQLAPLT